MLSLLLQEKTGVTKSGLKIDIKFYDNFLWIHFKPLNPVQSFQGDSLLLTTKSLGVPATLLINLNMKTPSGLKSVNPGLGIGNNLIDSLLFQYNKAMYKI